MESILNVVRKRYHEMSIEVDMALYNKALTGDPRAIDLWYKRIEGWNPSQHDPPVTKIQIVFQPGMLTVEEQQRIDLTRTGPPEIEGDEISELLECPKSLGTG